MGWSWWGGGCAGVWVSGVGGGVYEWVGWSWWGGGCTCACVPVCACALRLNLRILVIESTRGVWGRDRLPSCTFYMNAKMIGPYAFFV